jgi:hypothetical protein
LHTFIKKFDVVLHEVTLPLFSGKVAPVQVKFNLLEKSACHWQALFLFLLAPLG